MTAPVLHLRDSASLLPPFGGLLGLDLGTKTIGVAACDATRRIVTPVETIARKKFSIDIIRLRELAQSRQICGFVLGLPLNMDGSEGPRAQSTRAFARNMSEHTELPILFWDERLSTMAAERFLIEQDVSRNRRAKVIDQHAALYILQGAVELLNSLQQAD